MHTRVTNLCLSHFSLLHVWPFWYTVYGLTTCITSVWALKWSHSYTSKQEHSTHKVAGETLMIISVCQIKYPDRSRCLLAWCKITVSLWSAPLLSTIFQRATDWWLIQKWLITLMALGRHGITLMSFPHATSVNSSKKLNMSLVSSSDKTVQLLSW